MERGGEDAAAEERRHLRGSLPVVNPGGSGHAAWPTVDGPLGLSDEESVAYARSFFRWGFCFLPFLWGVNCFYFWPVLRTRPSSSPNSFHRIRPYVVRSAIGFGVFSVLISTWALTFVIGGQQLFGPIWNDLVMYNIADKLGLNGWM